VNISACPDPQLDIMAQSMGSESLRIAREKYDVHKVNKVIMGAMGV